MTFGQKLKQLRTDNNLTQDELADKIFVTRTAVSKWETDKGYPSIDSLKLLAALFGCTLDELMRDADLQNKHISEARKARRCYFAAVGCFVLALLFAVLSVGCTCNICGLRPSCSWSAMWYVRILRNPLTNGMRRNATAFATLSQNCCRHFFCLG